MQNRFINSFIFSLLCCLLCLFSCKQDFSPQDTKSLQLTAEYVEVTEAWLKLSVLPPDSRSTYIVKRDTHIVFSGKLDIADTIIHDRNLEPNKDYAYRAWREVNGEKTGSRARLNITTMDTTSHNFSWKTYEFGAKSSSVFYDVAIINENDIWAVGKIFTEDTYTYDSLGNWIEPYNAAHWDGEKWELKRIKTKACGGVVYPPIESVFAFSTTDVWFSHGGSVTHYNGVSYINDCSIYSNLGGAIRKFWGVSQDDLYGVGGNGFVAHYNGQGWQKIESGTELYLSDIYGVSSSEIYAAGIRSSFYRGVVLKFDGQSWQKMIEGFIHGQGFSQNELFKSQLYGTTEGIWVDDKGTLYTVGNLMYQYKHGKWNYVTSLPENYINGNPNNFYRGYLHAIKGNACNDILIFGESNTIIHYNGQTWKKIGPAYIPFSDHLWLSCDVKRDISAGAGMTGNAARIIILRR